ncbi:MAG: zinc-binding dehydrogenase [Chloroflexi bacterium]|nr:zinc-binding dehydrogenase [Chloroflexota bacterium]
MRGLRVVFAAPRQVALEEYEVGEPGPGQVLVKAEKTLISTGTELTGLSGEFSAGSAWADYVRYPWRPGYSHVGRVLATGEGVQGVQPGMLVAGGASHASPVVVEQGRVRPLPPAISAEEATFVTLAVTVLNGVRRARIELGEVVVLVGVGLLGQLAAQFARLSGGLPVIVVDLAPGRLELAARLGATHTLCLPVADALPEVRRLSRGRGADAAFEVTGHPAVVAPLLRLLRREGRAILLGSTRGLSQVDFHDEVHRLGLYVIGAHASTHPPAETPHHPWTQGRHRELFFDLLAAGLVNVRDLITHRYPAAEAAAAYGMLLEDRTRAVGVILDWTGVG